MKHYGTMLRVKKTIGKQSKLQELKQPLTQSVAIYANDSIYM